MNNFKTKKAAQNEADKRNKEHKPEQFCPLIKDTCRKDCVCFQEAHVTEQRDPNDYHNEFLVFGLWCDNAMFDEHYIQQ